MGQEDWLADPDLAGDQGRGRRQAELDAAVGAWTSRFPLDEVNEQLAHAGVPAGPAYDIEGIYRDPQFLERGMIAEIEDPDVGPLALPGIVPRLSRTPGEIRWAGPRLGEHNAEVYGDLLGLSADAIADLQARRVI